jgi:hypothetical protein
MIQKGTQVTWKWGNGTAEGKVMATHKEEITKKIKDSEVSRKGGDDDKALEMEQEDGTTVLKLESEVERKD